MSQIESLEDSARAAAQKIADALADDGAIYAELEDNREEVDELMDRVLASEEPGDRLELYSRIRIALLAHGLAEQRQFYRELERHPETRHLARQHQLEHDEIESLLERLDDLDCRDPAWLERLRELRQMVTVHVAREERELFPAARQVLGRDTRPMVERFRADTAAFGDRGQPA